MKVRTPVTLQEIARAMGNHLSSVKRRANKEQWPFVSETVRGGRRKVFDLDLLPETVSQAVRKYRALQEVNKITSTTQPIEVSRPDRADQLRRKEQGLSRLAALPDADPRKRRARAREWVIRRWSDYADARKSSLRACVQDFVEAYKAGDISVPEQHLEMLPKLHGARSLNQATLYRWRKVYREQGLAGLMDGYGTRKGAFKVAENEELKNVVLGCLMQAPHITPGDIKAYLAARHPQLDIVSEKSIERFIKHWRKENAQLWTLLTNPDQWKNEYMVAHGSHHESVKALNQLWEMDSTPADWMLQDGRHNVIGAIDMYSRRLRFHVSKTSTAEALGLTFRRCALDWGIPEAVRTDNGADYVSHQFSTVLRDLEIDHRLCLPFASEQKGTIERAMRTMSHGILDLLPGFIGHNVAQRKAIEARKSFADRIMTPGETVEVSMTAAELQERLDQWCDHVYMHNKHAGLKATPWQIISNWTQPVRRLADPRALDALLAPIAGERRVTKKGIKLDHYHYIAPELAEHVGMDVFLRRDPDDIGRIFVYDTDGVFICAAQAHEILGISRAEAAAAAKHHQRRFLSEKKKDLQEARRAIRENIGEAVLQHRIETTSNLASFPKPSEPYSTAALEQHGRAARAGDETQAPERDETTERAVRELEKEMATPKKADVIPMGDPMAEYSHWCYLDQRVQEGRQLGDRERGFYENYPRTEGFQSMKEYFEEFGLDPLEGYGA